MLRRLYDRTVALAAGPSAPYALALVSFVESSVFPIPPDALLIPMALAAPTRALRFALICSVASVLGGIFGYAIGYFLFETLGRAVLDFYGGADLWFEQFKAAFNDWGFWWVAFAGFTPFPYKVITIASGVTKLDFATFILASTLSRSARFFLVALLLRHFGTPIRLFIEQRLALLTFLFFALLFGGFLVVKYLL